jgi:hypothetical protein
MGCITLPLVPKEVSRVPSELKRAMQKSLLFRHCNNHRVRFFHRVGLQENILDQSYERMFCITFPPVPKVVSKVPLELKRAMQKSLLTSYCKYHRVKFFHRVGLQEIFQNHHEPMGCITLPLVPKEVSRVPSELKRAMQKFLHHCNYHRVKFFHRVGLQENIHNP